VKAKSGIDNAFSAGSVKNPSLRSPIQTCLIQRLLMANALVGTVEMVASRRMVWTVSTCAVVVVKKSRVRS